MHEQLNFEDNPIKFLRWRRRLYGRLVIYNFRFYENKSISISTRIHNLKVATNFYEMYVDVKRDYNLLRHIYKKYKGSAVSGKYV